MMKRITLLPLSAMAFAAVLSTGSNPAAACGTEAYTGQICVVAGSYCPSNTAEAAGQLLPIATYEALYTLYGCTYGGDCRSTFQLPDLRGRVPVQYGQGTNLTPRVFGEVFGREGVTPTIAMMAPHTHVTTITGSGGTPAAVKARQADGTTNIPQNGSMLAQGVAGLDPANVYLNPAATPGTDVALGGVSGTSTGGSVTIGITGGGFPLSTVPPSLAMRYCVVLNGLYPSRP